MNYLFVFILGIIGGYQIQWELRKKLIKRFKNLLDDYYELLKKKKENQTN